MYSEAQKKATAKYNAKAYDRMEIKVPKGKREPITKWAKERGFESYNAYIISLIEKDMERK